MSPEQANWLVHAVLSGRFCTEALLDDPRPDGVLPIQIQQLLAHNSRIAGTVWQGCCFWSGSKTPVVTKRFDRGSFDELTTELEAYSRLSGLAPAVANCLAVIAPRSLDWMMIVLEDTGQTIEQCGGWASLAEEEG